MMKITSATNISPSKNSQGMDISQVDASIKSYRIAVFGTSVSSPYLPLLEENLRKKSCNPVPGYGTCPESNALGFICIFVGGGGPSEGLDVICLYIAFCFSFFYFSI